MQRRIAQIIGALVALFMTVGLSGAVNAAVPSSSTSPPAPNAKPAAPRTHDRMGQLVWDQTGPTSVHFEATAGIRRSFYNPPPNVGDIISFAAITYGDGGVSNSQFTVTFVDVVHDWIIAEKEQDHTYGTAGPYTASFGTCCRLSATAPNWHVNNPDQSFQSQTIVNLNATSQSIASGIPPIVDCPIEGTCGFLVPWSWDGPIHFRFSTATEAGDSRFVQPGPPFAPHAATIDPVTGQYTWDTHGATLAPSGSTTFYSTQVMIEGLNVFGQVVTKTAVDFFIRLIPVTVNHPPYFVYPPTPPDGTTFTVIAGNNVTFDVRAADPDVTDTVTLAAVGLPPGASFPIPPASNPVQSTLSWTPTDTDAGPHVINFTATDQSTAQAFTSVTILVIARTPTPTQTATNTGTPTNTPTRTPTNTNTPTNTPSNTPTNTNTPSNTPSNTPTNTPTGTNTPSNTPTNTPTGTNTPSNTPTNTPTGTNTPSNTPTNTPTGTNTPTNTPSNTPTRTPTGTNTPTNTPTNAPTGTNTPSNTPSNTPTNTPTPVASTTCVPETAVPVITPAFTPGPGCSSTPPSGMLSAVITDHPTTTTALFTNHSATCSYPIGLAVYRKVDNNIDHQILYDYALAVIPPHSSLTLTVNNPSCAYQGDAFYGNLVVSFAGGVRYGVRRLDDTDGNGTNYCSIQCLPPPPPTLPPPPPTLSPPPPTLPPPPPTVPATTVPCSLCNTYISDINIACNGDGSYHWTATVRNNAQCTVNSTWQDQLQIQRNYGGWHTVQTQTGSGSFPAGDTTIGGNYCYLVPPNTTGVRHVFKLTGNPPSCRPDPISPSIAPCPVQPTCSFGPAPGSVVTEP